MKRAFDIDINHPLRTVDAAVLLGMGCRRIVCTMYRLSRTSLQLAFGIYHTGRAKIGQYHNVRSVRSILHETNQPSSEKKKHMQEI